MLMDDELREILEKQEKTHILVEKLWRAEKWRRFWAVFRYTIYLGVILGAFYFLNPYIERYLGAVQGLLNSQNPQELKNILQQLPK